MAVCFLWLAVAVPLSAQRAVPGRVPTGPTTVPTPPVPTGPGSLTGTVPQIPTPVTVTPIDPTSTSGISWTNGGITGDASAAAVGGSDDGAVVDSGAEDEARAFEYLERESERTDLLGGAPVLGKMRRLRR